MERLTQFAKMSPLRGNSGHHSVAVNVESFFFNFLLTEKRCDSPNLWTTLLQSCRVPVFPPFIVRDTSGSTDLRHKVKKRASGFFTVLLLWFYL